MLAAVISATYSAGIAAWDEKEDLVYRFGTPWRQYRAFVHHWIPRWRPYGGAVEAKVYIARSCEPCSRVRRWIEARHPVGLRILDAESLPAGSIQRMTYDPGDGTASVDGVRAMARVWEHLHLGWAILGAIVRLPGVWQVVQMIMDVSGFGPRVVVSDVCALPVSEKN